LKEFVEFIVKNVVDHPESVKVEEIILNDHTIEFKLKVDISDLGKVIGKQGRNVNAMRTIITAVGAKGGNRIILQIIE